MRDSKKHGFHLGSWEFDPCSFVGQLQLLDWDVICLLVILTSNLFSFWIHTALFDSLFWRSMIFALWLISVWEGCLLREPAALKWTWVSQVSWCHSVKQRVTDEWTENYSRSFIHKNTYWVFIIHQELFQILDGTHTLTLCLNFFSRLYALWEQNSCLITFVSSTSSSTVQYI